MTDERIEQETASSGSRPMPRQDDSFEDGRRLIAPEIRKFIDLDEEQIKTVADTVPGGLRNIEDIYPLSPAQEGMLFHHLLHEASETYLLTTLLEMDSQSHLNALINAVQSVINRHDVLRSAVIWERLQRPVQVVYREATVPVEYISINGDSKCIKSIEQAMQSTRSPMDLRRAPLIRIWVAAHPDEGRVFAMVQRHHIVFDHQSWSLAFAEIMKCIQGIELPPPPAGVYRRYVASALARTDAQDAAEFFHRKLGDVVESTAPFGISDVHGDGQQVEEASEVLQPILARRIRMLSRSQRVSPARLFHAAWALVVARTSGRDDVVYGTVLSIRRRNTPLQSSLGMLVNTLPLRIDMTGATAEGLVARVSEELAELLNYQQCPLILAQRSGATGAVALFTTVLNYRHSSEHSVIGENARCAPGFRVIRHQYRTNYPIALVVDDLGHGFAITAQVDARIDPSRILGFVQMAMRSLVDALEQAPRTSVKSLSILPEFESQTVISQFNSSRAEYSGTLLVHEMVDQQAIRIPNSVAAISGGQQLTYAELNDRANRVAHELRSRGVQPDQRVGIYIERGIDMLVGWLGTLKAGAGYVPLELSYPAERLHYILRESEAIVVLTQRRLRAHLPEANVQVIEVDSIDYSINLDIDSRAFDVGPRNLALVIYTSGSTGTPKGVMIEHASLANHVRWHCDEFGLKEGSRCSSMAAVGFDAASAEIWTALSVGGTLVMAAHDLTRDVSGLLDWWSRQTLDVSFLPTAVANLALSRGIHNPTLRVLWVGGDRLRHRSTHQHYSLINVYGPTETTVLATAGRIDTDDTVIHLGRPMANALVYILDQHLRPAPIGVAGEIYIGGPGVARGYLNRPCLTAERFLPDPFSPRARMYKTGDLGRWRIDGTVEFIGRNDDQVKIRGFRIELGEIEARLALHRKVKEAVVVAQGSLTQESRLVAYVILKEAGDWTSIVEILRAHLKQSLPEYMVPAVFIPMDRFPITLNGKVDRSSLPTPEIAGHVNGSYETPQGHREEILAGIWQALLRVDRVGRRDNFFELGGHSLLVVQLMEQLRRVSLTAEVRRIFESSTLADMASTLVSTVGRGFDVPPNMIPEECRAITPEMLPLVDLESEDIERIVREVPGGAANIEDIYPLAPLQEGMLFHSLLNESIGDVYLVPTLLSIRSRRRLDDLVSAVQKAIDEHEVLRTAVLWEKLPCPLQVVYRKVKLPVEEIVFQDWQGALSQMKQWASSGRLDLRRAPLMRLRFYGTGDSEHLALLEMHHIVGDGQSFRVLMSEIVSRLEGREMPLSSSALYRNHVAEALAYARTGEAEAFFRRKLGDVDEPTVPFGLVDVHGDGGRIEEVRADIEPALATRVREQARRYCVSAATLFHAACALVVGRTSGRHDVVFGTVLLGRLNAARLEQGHAGMFINTLPLRLRLDGTSSKELIGQTQRELVELLAHEQASLVVAQRCAGIAGTAPLFTTLFNFRHGVRPAHGEWFKAEGIEVLARRALTNFPIALSIDDLGEGFALTAQTDRSIDPRRISDFMMTALDGLVRALENEPSKLVRALSILPVSERRQLEIASNAAQISWENHGLVHRMFEEQVLRTPNEISVVHDELSLTYQELNCKANQLARHLRRRGVGPDKLVGICVERGQYSVIGVLGILKAGAAYIPLDPSYPGERLQYLLSDANPQVVITQVELRSLLPESVADVIVIDSSSIEVDSEDDQNIVDCELAPDNLLYVLYTSGSTGTPKGVVMSHRAIANLIEWHRNTLSIMPGRRVMQFAALSFDVAFQEVFTTVCAGGTLVLISESFRKDTRALMRLLQRQCIETLFLPPLMLQSLAEHCETVDGGFPHLKDVIVAGEQLRISAETMRFFNGLNGRRLHNHYGPTETHVVTSMTLDGEPADWPELPPIGRPIANTQVYVLDKGLQAAPVGVVGEIYIGGVAAARGYLRRPAMTADRFIADPLTNMPGARMYRTGDTGRWRAGGLLECLGRCDDQVKIRGYRIELGEIEAQLVRLKPVKEAAVVAREGSGGERRLVAYVILNDLSDPSTEKLRKSLASTLPEYMVPNTFVVLERFPLTATGKLNRRELPEPDVADDGDYEAPEGGVEIQLAEIWEDLLGVGRVSRRVSFFDLGGHSLLVLRLLFRVTKALGVTLNVSDVYQGATIEALARRISEGAATDAQIDLSVEARLSDDTIGKGGPRCTPAKAILLTGATGFVGRFLLRQLLLESAATVYCLVRARSSQQAMSRIRGALERWDLWADTYAKRIVALPGDLREKNLGMEDETYQKLMREVDEIYHCGTSMNHLETYVMAKSANVNSSKELLKFATRERRKVINYVSTLGVFSGSAGGGARIVDETSSIDHETHWNSGGYVASKWVSEKIFMMAMERGVPCNIFRLGLLWADSEKGRYDEAQRGYRMLKSCLLSGCAVRNYRFSTTPIPVDHAARAIVCLGERYLEGGGIFHISSPTKPVEGLFEQCSRVIGKSLNMMPYYDWIREVKRLHEEGQSLPVVPLIEFAFSMDESSFYQHQRKTQERAVMFLSDRTDRELERAGIVAPQWDDGLLAICIEDMMMRDRDFQASLEHMSYIFQAV